MKFVFSFLLSVFLSFLAGCGGSADAVETPIAPEADAGAAETSMLPTGRHDAGPSADAVSLVESGTSPDAGLAADGQADTLVLGVDADAPQDAPPDGCAAFDWQNDSTHCGACGSWIACNAAFSACSHGMCCPRGTSACGGSCVNLLTDGMNCSACGQGCASGVCVGGHCQ